MGRRNGAAVSPKKREILFELMPPNCYYCMTPFSRRRPATVEHIVPVCRGGSNHMSNLALTCSPCNAKKGSMTGVEFLESLGVKNPVTRLGHYKGDIEIQSVYVHECDNCSVEIYTESLYKRYCGRLCNAAANAQRAPGRTPIFDSMLDAYELLKKDSE